jgi:hypothetical protein
MKAPAEEMELAGTWTLNAPRDALMVYAPHAVVKSMKRDWRI